MTNATVAFCTQSIELPLDRTFSHHLVFLTRDGKEGEPIKTTDSSVRFTDLQPGRYFAAASSIADDGSVLAGPFISESLVVPPPNTTVRPPPNNAQLVSSLFFTLDKDMNTEDNKTANTDEAAKADTAQTAQVDPNNTLEHQGNADGHADQQKVAEDAATKKTDDGTATTGPSDA